MRIVTFFMAFGGSDLPPLRYTLERDSVLVGYAATAPALLSQDPAVGESTFSRPDSDSVAESFAIELGNWDRLTGVAIQTFQLGLNFPFEKGTTLMVSPGRNVDRGIAQLIFEDVIS